ncbi:MAG: hypothetical protein RTU30_10250 [Candidatus Thorarchaeota archaeon]
MSKSEQIALVVFLLIILSVSMTPFITSMESRIIMAPRIILSDTRGADINDGFEVITTPYNFSSPYVVYNETPFVGRGYWLPFGYSGYVENCSDGTLVMLQSAPLLPCEIIFDNAYDFPLSNLSELIVESNVEGIVGYSEVIIAISTTDHTSPRIMANTSITLTGGVTESLKVTLETQDYIPDQWEDPFGRVRISIIVRCTFQATVKIHDLVISTTSTLSLCPIKVQYQTEDGVNIFTNPEEATLIYYLLRTDVYRGTREGRELIRSYPSMLNETHLLPVGNYTLTLHYLHLRDINFTTEIGKAIIIQIRLPLARVHLKLYPLVPKIWVYINDYTDSQLVSNDAIYYIPKPCELGAHPIYRNHNFRDESIIVPSTGLREGKIEFVYHYYPLFGLPIAFPRFAYLSFIFLLLAIWLYSILYDFPTEERKNLYRQPRLVVAFLLGVACFLPWLEFTDYLASWRHLHAWYGTRHVQSWAMLPIETWSSNNLSVIMTPLMPDLWRSYVVLVLFGGTLLTLIIDLARKYPTLSDRTFSKRIGFLMAICFIIVFIPYHPNQVPTIGGILPLVAGVIWFLRHRISFFEVENG